MKPHNLVGMSFGRLLVVEKVPSGRQTLWLCRCQCGKTCLPSSSNLVSGRTKSCGCLRTEELNSRGTLRRYHLDEYCAWASAKNRCNNNRNLSYENYGARGISMCKEWALSFETFLSDMGPKPSKRHQLDRIDVDGNYCPENCRWALPVVQQNNRRNTIQLLINGRKLSLQEASRQYGVNEATIRRRLRAGYRMEEAVVPVRRLSGRPLLHSRRQLPS